MAGFPREHGERGEEEDLTDEAWNVQPESYVQGKREVCFVSAKNASVKAKNVCSNRHRRGICRSDMVSSKTTRE
jgi:hypothetical protein